MAKADSLIYIIFTSITWTFNQCGNQEVKWELVNKFQGPVNGNIYISLINSHLVVNGQMIIEIHVALGKDVHDAYVDF